MRSGIVAVLAAMWMAAMVGTASAGNCWMETAWYVKYGCQVQGKTQTGQYILLCCN